MTRKRIIAGPQQEALHALLDKRASLRKQMERLSLKSLATMFQVDRKTIKVYAERHSESKRSEP